MSPALRNFLITFAASILVFGIIAWFLGSAIYGIIGGIGGSDNSSDPSEEEIPVESTDNDDEPLNVSAESFTVLLIGTDVRERTYLDYENDRPEELISPRPRSADAVILIHFDKESKQIVLCGIPSDTIVQYEGAETSLAEYYGYAGVDNFRAKISAMTGFSIDYYFAMNIEDFPEAYDKTGWAVSVDIPSVVNDGTHNGMYYVDEAQGLIIDLPAGTATISTGSAAEQYLLFAGDGETARLNRITSFVSSVIKTYGMSSTLSLYKKVGSLFITDMTLDNLSGKIDLITAYDKMSIVTITYPIASETAQKYRH